MCLALVSPPLLLRIANDLPYMVTSFEGFIHIYPLFYDLIPVFS